MDSTVLRAIRLTTISFLASVVGVLTISCGSKNDPATPTPGEDAAVVEQPDATGQQETGPTIEAGPFLDAGPCVPQPIDCTGKCGPIRDACSGEVTMCGGCPTGEVCDLEAHTCGTPKVTCEDFGAECGQVKTSCGEYKSCGDCPAGKECNPDTNKCVDAQTVTCQDLGYECGIAWLGSGNRSVGTNCGTCTDANKPRCNATYNKCEPACTAPWKAAGLTAQQIKDAKKAFCDAAKQTKGIECGIISDGCGGVIDCTKDATGFTCPAGQGCGVRGVANRCEPFPTPPECEAIGRNCGEIVSVCTGKKITCGLCTGTGEVCNDNGVCGPPCTAKTCATALAAGQQCGTVSDGCKGTLNCTCPNGGKCQNNTTCCAPKTCAQLLANGAQCGKQLDDGCGGKVDCNCPLGGQRCVNGSNQQVSNGQQGSCCQRKTCANDYPGQCGDNLSDGCGGTIDCNCSNGQTCIIGGPPGQPASSQPGTAGSCCAETNCNGQPQCPASQVASVCVAGQNINCGGCPGGQVCNNNTCCQPTGCGNQCNIQISDGCGGQINCGNCTGTGQICTGNQCVCTPLTCNDYPGQCGNHPNGCGGTINCDTICSPGQVCNNNNVTCCTPKTCNDYPGQCGNKDNGCGGTINCNGTCTGGQVCINNNQCCSPKTCAGDYAGLCGNFDNGCQGTLNCDCGGGQVCNPNNSTCCTKKTCAQIRTQLGSDVCGTFADGCNTGNVTCGCTGTDTCGGGPKGAGFCGCTKKTCADYPGQVGALPDGCGGTISPPCSG